MKPQHKLLMIVSVLMILLVAGVPTFAQSAGKTSTVTEDRINEPYRVTNNPRRAVTDIYVDLVPDKVVISATITLRSKEPVDTVTTLVPDVTNGRVYWSVESATANGEPVSAELLTQINALITSSWRRYFKNQAGPGHVESIQISDTELTVVTAPKVK